MPEKKSKMVRKTFQKLNWLDVIESMSEPKKQYNLKPKLTS